MGNMPVSNKVLIIKSTSVAIRWSTDLKKLVGRMSSSDVEELGFRTVFPRVSKSIGLKLGISFS